MFIWWIAVAAQAEDPTIKFHFINVGQGAATLIEAKCGLILIDAGGQDDDSTAKLIAYLNKVFERRPELNKTIELVGITHTHIDHTLALRKVVESFTVKRYLDNGRVSGSGKANVKWVRDQIAAGQPIQLKAVTNADVLAVPDHKGLTDDFIDPLHCDDCDPKIRILSGSRTEQDLGSSDFDNENDHSIVWRIDYGKIALLITGDLEKPAIAKLVTAYAGTDVLDVDLYEVGHHGSANGTTQALLDAMTPTRAIMEVGRWNFGQNGGQFTTFAYGHPRLSTVQLLEGGISKSRAPKTVKVANGVRDFRDFTVHEAVYATGWDGNIVMTGKLDGTLSVRTNQ